MYNFIHSLKKKPIVDNYIIDKEKKYNISLLIPCTSKGRPQWKNMKGTYLYNYTLKTFLLTQSKGYNYTFYIGYDSDDRIYSQPHEQEIITRFSKVFKNINFKFVPFQDIKKGHVTKMWNILFEKAYNDGNEYFFQCGDDIDFKTKNWVQDCILKLNENDNIGLTGPINNNNRILTQAFVSRKHMEIFGWFFPEEIINWCCDDWYNYVYKPDYLFPLINHYCSNEGGQPRYDINNNANFKDNFSENTNNLRKNTYNLAHEHKRKINYYIRYKNNKNK